jgi:excisionase family DNA binding protein
MQTKADLIEANELPPGVAEAVFSRIHPLAHREDGEPLYLESAVDRAIEMVVERKRSDALSLDHDHPISLLANRLVVFLEQWAKNKEQDREAKEPEYLSPTEAARRLSLNKQTVVKWCRSGEIQASKVCRKWLIPKAEIDRYLNRTRLIKGINKGETK